MDTANWAPVNETSADIWNERSILDGLFLGAIAYGIHLTLFVWTFRLLYMNEKNSRSTVVYSQLVYIAILFILGNIGNATNIKFGEMTFIDDRNYPGGPNAFFVEQSTTSMAVICNTAYIVNSWLQDGLLLYRFWVISQKSIYTVVFPSLMFLSSVVLSLFLIVELSQPGITLWSKISVNLAIPYWSISIALNVIITTYIAARLLYMRRQIRHAIPGGGQDYVSITAMLVESAALYTTNGLFFLISFAVNSPIQNLALPLLGQTQSISPLLIILRVAQGRAWSDDTISRLNTAPSQFRGHVGTSSFTMAHEPKSYGSSTVLETINFQNISNGDLDSAKENGNVIDRRVEVRAL